MPTATDIISSLATPPLPSLQQVLDTNGPFGAGDHVIDNFHTDGAFLLPAGTYAVGGTYGVVVRLVTIPAKLGFVVGFNGVVSGQDITVDVFRDPLVQVACLKSFPITGAIFPIQIETVQLQTQLILWAGLTAAPNHVGLHVFPGCSVDLFWMCVL